MVMADDTHSHPPPFSKVTRTEVELVEENMDLSLQTLCRNTVQTQAAATLLNSRVPDGLWSV